MASSESILHGSSLKAPAIQVIDLVSDDDSTDDALHARFDRDPDASNGVETIGSDDDADDGNWSLYEDVFDVIESDEIVPGGRGPSPSYDFCLFGQISNVS